MTYNQPFTLIQYYGLGATSGTKLFECSFSAELPVGYLGNFSNHNTYNLNSSVIVNNLDGLTTGPFNFESGGTSKIAYNNSSFNSDPTTPFYTDNQSITFVINFEHFDTFKMYFDLETLDPTLYNAGYEIIRLKVARNSSLTLELYDDLGILVGQYYGSKSTTEPENGQINQVLEPSLSSCFNRGTVLLGPHGGVAVETLKVGDLLSTYLHGDRKITRILRGVAFNKDSTKAQNTMCVMNGLYLTGGHSLMVDELSAEEAEKQDAMGFSQKVDDKHLLLAMVSPLFEAAPPGTYQHYHFLLENDGDKTARYGVWANGVLCETPSQEYIESLGK
jgi:hypothetical protein